jgi:tRNA1(Val) A37 N6-methylase TrmN6
MTNPPYFERNKATPSSQHAKALATIEDRVPLKVWIDFCLLMVRPKGTLTLIFPADRLEEVLPLFRPKSGEITIYPLWPGPHKPAKRLLIRVRKNSHAVTRLFPGLVLHSPEVHYTAEADKILRACGTIAF